MKEGGKTQGEGFNPIIVFSSDVSAVICMNQAPKRGSTEL